MSPESFGRLVHVLRAAIARTDVLRGFFSSQSIVLPVTAGRPSNSEASSRRAFSWYAEGWNPWRGTLGNHPRLCGASPQ